MGGGVRNESVYSCTRAVTTVRRRRPPAAAAMMSAVSDARVRAAATHRSDNNGRGEVHGGRYCVIVIIYILL